VTRPCRKGIDFARKARFADVRQIGPIFAEHWQTGKKAGAKGGEGCGRWRDVGVLIAAGQPEQDGVKERMP
jgi:hypothetical protein